MKTEKSIFQSFKSYVSTLDRFPVTFQFRVGNKHKLGTFLGGFWYLIFILLSCFFMIKKTRDFFNWSEYTLTFVEKAVYPTPKMNFNEMEFNYALQITFENSTSIMNSKYRDLFKLETYLIEKKGKDFSKIVLNHRPCDLKDFKESTEDPLFIKTQFDELICIEKNNLSLYGTHHDKEMSYINNRLKISTNYLKDEEKLKEIFKNNLFKLRLYYIDVLNDVSSLENPIFQKIDSVYFYLDYNFLKKIRIGFQEFNYKEDRNLFIHHIKEKRFIKKFDLHESDISMTDRLNSNMEYRDELVNINLVAQNNIKIVTKIFLNLFEFLLGVSANLSNILIWSSIIINIYNQMQVRQYVMSKIMKYNDKKSNEKARKSINYFTGMFNNRLIEEMNIKLPSILLGSKKDYLQDENIKNKENLNDTFISDSNKNPRNIINKNSSNQRILIQKNIGIRESNLKNKNLFDPKNFLKRDTLMNPNKSASINIELNVNKNKDDDIMIGDANNTQKERLNESQPDDIENPEEIIEKSNPNSMGFFEILIYVFCCGNCQNVNKKGFVFEQADKIFNKNLDVINYMKKMQEIEIVKYLVLDNETLDLMNFLSKPSVSIGQRSFQDEEYMKFFYPSEKINSINYENINNLKISYDSIIARQNHTKIDKRILKLFQIQLMEMNK